ncbi:MAG: hypothetical protein IANPNBLG_00034 [Bryobacteraceae bacterium]|nr:hypothetical protein [Bryobacteraceae bacterium]
MEVRKAVSQHIFRQVWSAISHLNPKDVRTMSERNVSVGLYASNDQTFSQMETFLCPEAMSRERRLQGFQHIYRACDSDRPARFDIEIYEEGVRRPRGTFVYHSAAPDVTVGEILSARDDLALPLARLSTPFRNQVSEKVIHEISRENALFSLATALPDIVPNVLQLPWAIGEFASDTAFLTVNQVRMAFLLAAASDRVIGYSEQRGEIGSILAGAFGWRAIARELAGKIPFGGGLIPKAAIAYAGTYVAGRVLERLYHEGYEFSRSERRLAYESAFEKGKRVAGELIQAFRAGRGAAPENPAG